jgi:hypothetical protein
MERATPAPLWETLATPLGFWMAVYVVIGFLVAGYVIFRGMKLRRGSDGGPPWEKKDNARNGLYLVTQLLLLSGPIGFLIEIVLWPLVIVFLWAYDDAGEEEEDGAN